MHDINAYLLQDALEQLQRLQALLTSGKVVKAIQSLPEAHRSGSAEAINKAVHDVCHVIDNLAKVIHQQTGLSEAEAPHRDLVDEHG